MSGQTWHVLLYLYPVKGKVGGQAWLVLEVALDCIYCDCKTCAKFRR